MTLKYEDMLSGDPIPLDGIGHIRSPFLRELKPTNGIGTWKYNLLLQLLLSDKNDAIKYLRIVKRASKSIDALSANENITPFDVFTLTSETRELLLESLRFFIVEDVEWDDAERRFLVFGGDKSDQYIGCVDRNNYGDLCNAVLQLNYVNVDRVKKPKTFSSNEAKVLWERAQTYLKNTSKKKSEDKNMNIGNLISKFCSLSNNYTLLNVYDLTIFQFYDQVFQCAYLKAMNIGDMAYSMHGGDKYDSQAWLRPIYKY